MRHEKAIGDKGVAYGYDSVCGFFIQVWNIDPSLPLSAFKNMPDDSNIILDKDEVFNRLSWPGFLEIAKKYGLEVGEEFWKNQL